MAGKRSLEAYRRKRDFRTSPEPAGTTADPDRAAPRVVAQIGFTEWTPAGRLRPPRYQGLRRDKDPRDVVREQA